MQFYYPDQDMFEINRMLDRFGQLGKPIHITELGVSSATTRDEEAILRIPPACGMRPGLRRFRPIGLSSFIRFAIANPISRRLLGGILRIKGFGPTVGY